MPKVSFRTKTGKRVSFTTSGKRKRGKRKPGPYAMYVKKHIGKYIRQGFSAPEAMKMVAKEYRGGRRGGDGGGFYETAGKRSRATSRKRTSTAVSKLMAQLF